ncbi:TetR/AcrR family transcriptional regulator [Leucobacter soli]|uniref:HTH-type transcriptional regulator BetI n=1 Tax=Leucobacter soli TaxID=2812850 RepID=A0A916NHG5_9MICO|nr:TetR/AcrR family transcriptional regulator [Leucobacter soli]CAG7609808.1 HTH-type transcriptional regulator BetI [Leucobacter soli]
MASSRVSLDERREQLIAATISVMQEQGVQSITLRNVAQRANASLATVHYCFENKDALIHAAVVRWLENMVSYTTNIPTGAGFRAAVHSFAELYWADLERTPNDVLAQIELVLWAARNEDSGGLRSLVYTGYEDELSEIFAAALENESPGRDFDSRGFVRRLLTVFDGCSLQFLLQPELPIHRENYFFLIATLIDSVLGERAKV